MSKKTFPTLYSRTSTGAVQTWTMEVDGNKYRSVTGQIDGAKILNEWTIAKGKNTGKANETTDAEQALSEAQAKWDKKAKTGNTPDVNKIDTCTSYLDPMLAKGLDEYISKIDFKLGVLVQNKFNGFRCTAQLENGKVVLKSRKGELYLSVPHIIKDLEKFFAKFPDAKLDGELFNNELRAKLNEMSSLVRKSKKATADDLKRSAELVLYYIYDGFDFTDDLGADAAYEDRKAWIDENLPKYSKTFRKVDTTLVHSMAEVEEMFGKFIADGQEGLMVRLPGSPYEIGKRSKRLLKYKPEDDDEGIITAILRGDAGKAQYLAAKATVKWKGKVFNCTWMGTEEQRTEILKNEKDWIGKEVTFKYTGFTGLGTPNFGRIDPDNCFKGDR
jgi:DNA ligase 1